MKVRMTFGFPYFEFARSTSCFLSLSLAIVPLNLEKSLAEQQISEGGTVCLRSKKRDVKDVVKNAGNFLAKNVQKGFMEGTEKLSSFSVSTHLLFPLSSFSFLFFFSFSFSI